MRTRREFLRAAAVGAAAVALRPTSLGTAATTRSGGRPPNILLILADDLGFEKLSCYGCTSIKTPHLDKLAAEGVRFTRCHATPLCTPSRVQLLTGRYTFRNYVGFGVYPKGEATFAQMLRPRGYRNCWVGKWQLGGQVSAKDLGFDEWAIHGGANYWDTNYNVTGQRRSPKGYGPDFECDFLCDFIERHRDRPFLMYYPMYLVHTPIQPTPDSKEGSDHYQDMVRYMDKIVGRLVDKLDATGLRDDTLILFTADNGSARPSELNDQPRAGGKGQMHEFGTRVPLLASWGRHSPRGAVCDDLVDLCDFLPTMLQAAGMQLPADITIDGQSFLPQVLGQKGIPRQWALLHHWENGRKPEQQYRWAATKRYKLYRVVKGDPSRLDGNLYDLEKDPRERSPIPPGRGDAEAEAARKMLAEVLDSIEKRTTPPLPPLVRPS